MDMSSRSLHRDWYKYLEVYVFSSDPGRCLDHLILNEIERFFTAIPNPFRSYQVGKLLVYLNSGLEAHGP